VLDPESARQTMRIRDIVLHEPARANDEVRVTTGPRPDGSLSYDESSLDIMVIFAKADYRVQSGGMTMAGLDTPVTLVGALVIQNAYSLVGITLSYLLGVPANCAGAAHSMDLQHSMWSFGSPNQVLLGSAIIQRAPYYGFDAGVNSGLTDACIPDFQGGFENRMSAMVALLAGARGIGSPGIVGADQATSFEQPLIDSKWASALDHILQLGFRAGEETLAADVIKPVGIGGSYPAEEHTVRHMCETYWSAAIFNQRSWEDWMGTGGEDACPRAHQHVEAILADCYAPVSLLSSEVATALDTLIEDTRDHPERFRHERSVLSWTWPHERLHTREDISPHF
jgi:trimethylamine:corrinoid methyltransferase-like protein